MTTTEYIDAISRDLQDLINALDNDPNTSALVKGRAKYIQERINTYYDSLISATKLSEKQLTVGDNDLEQVPDAPPYKIGDEDYIDRVYCEHDTTKGRITNESNTNGDWQKSVRYI